MWFRALRKQSVKDVLSFYILRGSVYRIITSLNLKPHHPQLYQGLFDDDFDRQISTFNNNKQLTILLIVSL